MQTRMIEICPIIVLRAVGAVICSGQHHTHGNLRGRLNKAHTASSERHEDGFEGARAQRREARLIAANRTPWHPGFQGQVPLRHANKHSCGR